MVLTLLVSYTYVILDYVSPISMEWLEVGKIAASELGIEFHTTFLFHLLPETFIVGVKTIMNYPTEHVGLLMFCILAASRLMTVTLQSRSDTIFLRRFPSVVEMEWRQRWGELVQTSPNGFICRWLLVTLTFPWTLLVELKVWISLKLCSSNF